MLAVFVLLQVDNACAIVVACVVLHNACIRSGDDQPPDDVLMIGGHHVFEEIPALGFNGENRAGSTAARTVLINEFFIHQ